MKSVSPVDDKRLRIDVAILQECIDMKTIQSITHVSSNKNVANALTKQGASCKLLLNVLSGESKYNFSDNSFT